MFQILRVLNHYIKKKAHNVRPDVLELLLHLKIKEVNIDQQKENVIKQKTIKSHKHNVLKMSKKEKKVISNVLIVKGSVYLL